MCKKINENSLDRICGALAYAMGINAPAEAAEASLELCAYIDEKLGGRKVDRIFVYNPDAIGQWVYEKYPRLFAEADAHSELKLPLGTVMPSITPVCFVN